MGEANVSRPFVNYTPTMWSDTFTSFSLDDQVQEKYAQAIKELKAEALSMLTAKENATATDKLVLIDTLERLGIAYHFDHEIEDQLQQIFDLHRSKEEYYDDDDLFTTALRFRLLRQHRHHASSSVFRKFKREDKKFREILSSDAKGLLSLYEAAHLRIHREEILEEALAFATRHLNRMSQQKHDQLESPLWEQVKRALQYPLHRAVPRIEARHYISLYEKDSSKNQTLLKLAKLDFNYVQNLHKNELSQLYRWWNKCDLTSKLPYARDRLVEGYVWAMAFVSEPQCSDARIEVAKGVQLLTIFNDTYDVYATGEEADLLTYNVERWNTDQIDESLPDCMKLICRFTFGIYDDYERDAAKARKSFAVPYARDTVKQICKAYNKRLKWLMGRTTMPSLEDYLANSVFTSCIYTMSAAMIPGVKSASQETVDWLMSEPKIIRASTEMCRYLNDLCGYERESKLQGQTQTAIDWYMERNGLSMKDTVDSFFALAEDAWKDLNTEWIFMDDNNNNNNNNNNNQNSATVPKDMVEQVLNYARASELCYRTREDGFTRPEIMAHNVVALFVDPILL